MAESDPPHPLDGTDPDRCYDVMMAERTALITAKRETEDELVRTIIKLSSASLLLLPGLLLTAGGHASSVINGWLTAGAIAFALSLLAAMLEQFLSSKAYDRQIRISIDFYQRKSTLTSDRTFSGYVRAAQVTAFALFVIGIIGSAIGLSTAREEIRMAQEPRPPQPSRPSPEPTHIPDHKTDVPGRSVPPEAPPIPPRRG
jgi:preprotein translocase subunit Sss1